MGLHSCRSLGSDTSSSNDVVGNPIWAVVIQIRWSSIAVCIFSNVLISDIVRMSDSPPSARPARLGSAEVQRYPLVTGEGSSPNAASWSEIRSLYTAFCSLERIGLWELLDCSTSSGSLGSVFPFLV